MAGRHGDEQGGLPGSGLVLQGAARNGNVQGASAGLGAGMSVNGKAGVQQAAAAVPTGTGKAANGKTGLKQTVGLTSAGLTGTNQAKAGRVNAGHAIVGTAVSGSTASRAQDIKEHVGGLLGWPLRAASSLLLLALLFEWLLPLQGLPQWTHVYDLGILFALGAFILLIGVFLLSDWAAWLLRLVVILAGAALLGGSEPSTMESLIGLPVQLLDDAQALIREGPVAMSVSGQAVFLLGGLSILLSALQMLVWIRQWGIGLLALTALYLWSLNQWFGLDTLPNLARAAAEGLLLSALLSYHRLKRKIEENPASSAAMKKSAPRREMPGWRWWAASAAAAAMIPLGAAALSWGKVQTDGPAEWALGVQQAIRDNNSGSSGEGRPRSAPVFSGQPGSQGAGTGAGAAATGYSESDAQLGAPLFLSQEPIFWALSPKPLYWRMETKSAYTGQGWRDDTRELLAVQVGGRDAEAGGSSGTLGSGAEKSDVGEKTDVGEKADIGEKTDVGEKAESGARFVAGTGRGAEEGLGTEEGPGTEARLIRQTVWLPQLIDGIPLPVSGVEPDLITAESLSGGLQKKQASYLQEMGGGAIYMPNAEEGQLTYTVESRLDEPAADMLRQVGEAERSDAGKKERSIDAGKKEHSDAEQAERSDAGKKEHSIDAGKKEHSDAEQAERSTVEQEQLELQLKANLQLPAELPERVRELAQKIAKDAGENRYDRALAMQDYLKTSFRYTLTDTQVPGAGEDLVDQFLFEQKAGYCVHFSTAMVVMLRSVDIPARWVKGFAPGDELSAEQAPAAARKALARVNASGSMYQVSAADAHAWVEVYFPGAGWVPFDPTPGYAAGAEQPAAAAPPAVEGSSGGGEAAGEAPRGAEASSPALAEQLRAAAGDAARLAAALARAAAQPAPLAASAALAAAAAALASPALRGRLRLALALRRYARHAGAASAAAEARAERARRAAQRAALLAAAEALLRALERRGGAGPAAASAAAGPAERAAALAPLLAPEAGAQLRRLAAWAEGARFGAPAAWRGPTPAQLASCAAALQARRAWPSAGQAPRLG
ncbi:Transglutaminase-like superfamily protein [Paenibacillaceae bacterium GAS479]|nr:Transglutaminase-like superfamily protein [Paenibacillaceae bacterium GAS479]